MSLSPRQNLPWSRAQSIRVAVVGDLILDEYWEGTVARISPEAPVPVHLVTGVKRTAGGAANVARNIQLAGGQAFVAGVLGRDEPAQELLRILRAEGIDTRAVITDPERPTVRKTRITSQNHQIVRLDWEKTHPLAPALQESLRQELLALEVDGYVISDYAKGSMTEAFLLAVIKAAVSTGKPVVVDPKGRDYRRYRGATLITPNRKEALEALGRDAADPCSAAELASALQSTYGLGDVLVTLGAQGMYGLPAPGSQNPPFVLSARAREVYDVSGAGDTVAAIAALGLAAGCGLFETMGLANLAAGKVVEKWGTQPIYKEELLELLRSEAQPRTGKFSTKAKIIDLENLVAELGAAPQGRRRKVVFTNGCFDILHAGHVSYLEEARALGDLLVVAVNTDASIAAIKGPKRPIVPLAERQRLLAALSCVDYVVAFAEPTPALLIAQFIPDILVKGADYQPEDIVGGSTVLDAGGEVRTIELIEGLSTSAIIRRIQES